MYMASISTIRGEKRCGRDFPYSMHLACAANIRDGKKFPEILPRACTLPVQPIYMIKKFVWRIPLQHICSLYSLNIYIYIYMMKKVGPETSPKNLYVAFTASIRDEKCWSRAFPYSMYMASTSYVRYEKSWSRDFF
jgi:hypothetical protein